MIFARVFQVNLASVAVGEPGLTCLPADGPSGVLPNLPQSHQSGDSLP